MQKGLNKEGVKNGVRINVMYVLSAMTEHCSIGLILYSHFLVHYLK